MATPTFTLPTSGSDPRKTTKEWLEENLNQIIEYLDNARIRGDAAQTTGLNFQGPWDASTGIFPSENLDGGPLERGDFFWVSVEGTFGGETYSVNEPLVAVVDSPSTSDANDWYHAPVDPSLLPLIERLDTYPVSFDTVTDFFAATLAEIKERANATTGTVYVNTNDGIGSYTVDLTQSSAFELVTGGMVEISLVRRNGCVHLDALNPDGTRTNDSIAIRKAFEIAKGAPVIGSARRYYYDGAAVVEDRCCFIGHGQPQINSAKTALEGGTIIDGSIFFSTASGVFKDFGVDVGSGSDCSAGDGLKVKSPFADGLGGHLHTENITTLLKAIDSPHHAHLYENFARHTGGNLVGVYGFFGAVMKNSLTQLTSITTADNNESGSYFKSDASNGACVDVQVGSIRCDGALEFGLRILSDGASLRRVQIGKVAGKGNAKTVQIQNAFTAGVDLRNVEIQSIMSEDATVGDLCVDSEKAGGSIFNVDVTSLITIGSLGKGILTEGAGSIDYLRVGTAFVNYASGVSQAVMDAGVDIMERVNSSDIDNLIICQNYSRTTLGGIIYRGAATSAQFHRLGSHRCNVFGAGRPYAGYQNPTVSGSNVDLLVPSDFSGASRPVSKVSHDAAATVTSFSQQASGTVPSIGTLFTVLNGSGTDLTIAHNFAGLILNRNNAAVVLKGNETAQYVWGGSVWHQL